MEIKLIATDMDGTFLNEVGDYNRARFAELYKEMKRRKILFVVASGNQYYQLKSFFPDLDSEICYVAENGAYVIDKGIELYAAKYLQEDVEKIKATLEKLEHIYTIICGKKGAYYLTYEENDFEKVLGREGHRFHEMGFLNLTDIMSNFYHRLSPVDSYEEIDDQLFKFNIICRGKETESVVQILKGELDGRAVPVTSGHGSIDIIIPGVHKGNGIAKLAEKYGICQEQIMAFGDQGNDMEMIKYAKYGVAMENALDSVKRAASYIAPSHRAEGVLDTIEHYFTYGSIEK